jgi:hypothetical protein
MRKLERNEMKKLMGGKFAPGGGGNTPDCYNDACQGGGGGSSCWHNADWTSWDCTLNQQQAQQMQQQNGGNWCTASCCSSCSY